MRRVTAVLLLAVAVTVAALASVVDSAALARAYLLGWLLWLGVGLGAFVFLCIHHLVRGGWGEAIAPLLSAAARTVPLFALLFIPIGVHLVDLYPWADPAHSPSRDLDPAKAAYLAPTFVLVRSAVVLVAWSALAWLVADTTRPRPGLAAAGLVVYVLTITVAAVDWILSLAPNVSSSAFGLAIATGHALAGLSCVIIAAAAVQGRGPHAPVLSPARVQQLGTLLFAALMLWGYIAFSQYLLSWGADLPPQSAWYLQRTRGAWALVAWSLIALHFAVPFLLLLLRSIKRRLVALAAVAVLLFIMHAVELAWLVIPARAAPLGWLDLTVAPALGLLWMAAFAAYVGRTGPALLVPAEDIVDV